MLLIMVFAVSATMTGTLAVQTGLSNINHFFGAETPKPPDPPDPPSPGTVNITVNKLWTGDTTELRPASVDVQLYRDGSAYGGAVTLTAAGGWTHTWQSLLANYTYTIGEVTVPNGYTAAIVKTGNTVTITNTYTQPVVRTSQVTVNKVWSGEAPHPASVTATLYKDGAEFASIVLNDANNWTYTWTGLDREAKWTVGEPAVPQGYTAAITTAGNAFTITNTKIVKEIPPKDDEIVISGQKLWRHGSNAEADRPKSVTIYINADGVRAKEVTVVAPNWTYSVIMPRYSEGGSEIKYTVDEKAIPGYSSVVKGYSITNVHNSTGTGGPKTGDNSAMLLWFIVMLVSAISLRIMLRNTTIRRRRPR